MLLQISPSAFRLLHFVCCFLYVLNDAAAQELSCPPELLSSAIKLIDIPAPWAGSVQRYPLALKAAGFFDGAPSRMAELKPFSVKEGNKKVVEKWLFDNEYKWPEGKWLSCDYGDGVVSLSKEIPKEISECTVIYEKKNKAKPGLIQIVCK